MDSFLNNKAQGQRPPPGPRWRKALMGVALVVAGILTGQTALIVHPDALPALIALPTATENGDSDG